MTYSAELYMHDLDRKATAALNTFPKFFKLLEAYHANYDEKAAKFDFLSSAIRLSDRQMPEIYKLLPPVCDQLGINVPELYYVKSKVMNAGTGGSTYPYIFVTSRLVDELPLDLISSVLAHECGHIACKHTLYHSIAVQLINGIDNSPLALIPAIRRFLTPTLVRALLFWDRCSELSADRASVLCDGTAEKTVDVLLRINGYGKNIDRAEFLKQALDLKAFVNDSTSNKFIEQMLVQRESHPRMATRAYECYEWSHSEQYQGIVDGTYTLREKQEEENVCSEEEVVSAQLTVSTDKPQEKSDLDAINQSLQRVNSELERYSNNADRLDYALAVGSGILCGIIDSVFVGEFSLDEANQWGNKKTSAFVMKVAKTQGYSGDSPVGAIKYLEDMFPIAADKATNQFGGGLQHHLRDFSHHPTPVGLVCSVLTQFTGKVYGTDVHGVFQAVSLNEDGLSLIGKNFPEKIMFGVINWAFHMVSDMAGSSGSVMKGNLGTGLPGPLASMLKELSSTPLFQKMDENGHKELSVYISKLFNGTLLGDRDGNGKLISARIFDLRAELGVAHHVGHQAVPVIINECVIRAFYFIRRLTMELCRVSPKQIKDLTELHWNTILPFYNRTVERMVTISSMTFTVADTADAAIHAAIESGGDWVLFSGRFVTRFNYVGAGRAAIAIVKEVTSEKKEMQLIHEKMLLSEAKAALFLDQLQEFKAKLEEKVSNYLAEDISAFMSGFDYMSQGIASGDSDLVIKGNIVIQRVLGREPLFTNQKEFDDLMESDIPLVL